MTQITAAEETIVLPAGEEIGPFFTDIAMPDLHVARPLSLKTPKIWRLM